MNLVGRRSQLMTPYCLTYCIGDYVILVKSGMHWVTALLFNFLSSLTAIIGFFIGVAISSNSTEANGWILSLTAGLFIYIAMTDLVSLRERDDGIV